VVDDGVVIKLNGIHFSYSGRNGLISGLDFHVRRGDKVGVVGANGSGKTTLFHLIVGLVKASSGTIEVQGRRVRTESDFAFVRRVVGFLFQHSDDQLFSPTLADDVAFGPLNLGKSTAEATEIVAEALGQLGLAELADRITYQLSGGQRRLAALATVLAMKPEVFLLDEPAAGLDPRANRELISVLGHLGGTQIISSHDLEFVRATCRRVVVMNGGKLIAEGPTDDILSDAELMLSHGLEVPYSLEAHPLVAHDHHHGAGPSHGHGHTVTHGVSEHESNDEQE